VPHEYAGNYARKHPAGTKPDEKIAEAVRAVGRDGKIGCAEAFAIAKDLGAEPESVGVAIDLLEYRINRCQLGLFGYEPKKRIVEPAESVNPEMKKAILSSLEGGKLACAEAWKIADRFHCPRMDVAAACEALSIKINNCRLGSF